MADNGLVKNGFVTDSFKKYITSTIRNNILINLNIDEFNKIIKMLIELINYIAMRLNFDFDNIGSYEYQLKQNNNRDLYAIFNLLLPYIDDKEGTYLLHKKIENISDITSKKKNESLEQGFIEPTDDIVNDNITKNPYLITNLQFNRHYNKLIKTKQKSVLEVNNEVDNKQDFFNYIAETSQTHLKKYINSDNAYFYEYYYTIDDIYNNFYLLLNSIDQISNKLYVNWINIRPITWNYRDSKLYKNSFYYDITDKQFKLKDGSKLDVYNPLKIYYENYNEDNEEIVYKKSDNTYFDTRGISCGDIYNMIHHELYYGIKDYKWLIYDLPINNKYNVNIYWELIITLFDEIELYLKNDIEFDLIQNSNEKVIIKWNQIKNKLSSEILDNQIIKDLVLNLLYFLQRKFSLIYQIKESFIKLDIDKNVQKIDDEDHILELIDTDLDNDKNKMTEIPIEKLIESWNSLEIKYLYEFLRETIRDFKKTWYGYQIVVNNNYLPSLSIPFELNMAIPGLNKPVRLTYKNIYNWAKSVIINVYSSDDKSNTKKIIIDKLYYYKQYNWYSLEDIKLKNECKYRSEFIETINNANNDYFKITRVLRTKTFKDIALNSNTILIINNSIFENIRANLKDIIFECLLIRGTLNEFVIDRECTDKLLLTEDYTTKNARRINAVRKNIFNKDNVEKYKKSIYYLTGEPYENLPLIIKKNEKSITYFEALETGTWYTFYAMDWIAQINFFHRYINNRVLYVTGATGAGKSSQVPKLLLYGLKMINNNNKGKVVSTQPRISPTVSNAEQISEQMGVPIKAYSKSFDTPVKTFLSYIQYKTSSNSHLGLKQKYYFKEMTDGSLVEELINNPLLKKNIKEVEDDNFEDRYTQEFKVDENNYDIVIIDESHEHNKNMDIILTLMKYTTFWNNSIKLVIISATMDDDEPIYRRYFKDINDNMMFPINHYNINNYYISKRLQEYIALDRITVDRRIHISPPGETTQHFVKDIYLEKDTINYQEAEYEGIQKVLELIGKKAQGDMLFFTLGELQIRKIVSELNNNTPPNVIAIPFYSELPDFWKILGEKTGQIKDFDVHKDDLFVEIKLKGSGRKVPIGTYKQVIVVATNVAEASITIEKLKHVIETGYYNSITYNSITRSTEAKVAPITEASRLQRRGRVGRVSDGIVYYMYEKGSREENKPLYNICLSNIKDDLYKLLREKHDEDFYINNKLKFLDNKCLNEYSLKIKDVTDDQNIRSIHQKYYNGNYLANVVKENMKGITNKIKKSRIENIFKFIDYHYVTQSLVSNYSLLTVNHGEGSLGIYNTEINIHDRYETGYNMVSILDMCGTFHIIHPSENIAYRHILTGEINNRLNYNIGKFNRDFIIKTFSYLSMMYYSRMIIPYKVGSQIIKYDLTNVDDYELSNYRVYRGTTNYKISLYPQYRELKNLVMCDNTIPIQIVNDIFDKTIMEERFKFIYNLLELTDIELKDDSFKRGCIKALIYGKLMGIEDDICGVVAVLLVYGPEMKKLIPEMIVQGKPKFNFNKSPINQFKNNYGDIITYYYLFKSLQNDFKDLKIWSKMQENILVFDDQYDIVKNEYLEIKKDILNKIKNKDSDAWSLSSKYNLDFNKFDLIQKSDQKEELSSSKGKKNYIKEQVKSLQNNLNEEDIIRIIIWCKSRNLDPKNISKVIKTYLDLKNKLSMESEQFNWFTTQIKVNKEQLIEENIIKCFLLSFIENVLYYDNIKMEYTNIYNNIKYGDKKLFPGSKINDRTIYPNKYVLYLVKSNDNYPININNIKIEWLFEIVPEIVNPKNREVTYVDFANVSFYYDLYNKYSNKYIEELAETKPSIYENNLPNYFKQISKM